MSSEHKSDSVARLQEDISSLPFILRGRFFKVVNRNDNKVVTQCTTCKKEVKGNVDSTGNFFIHIRKHKGLIDDYKNAKVAIPKTHRATKAKTPLEQPKMIDILPKVKHNNMSKGELMQVKFIVGGLHPYSTVEEKGYRNMITGLSDNKYQPISRRTLGRRIGELFQNTIEAMIEKYKAIRYFSITVDAWSNKGNKRSFLGCTTHWIDETTLRRESNCLSCRRFVGSHTFDKIAKLLSEILQFYGIPVSKVVKGTCDNGSNFLKAFREFSTGEIDSDDDSDVCDEDDDELPMQEDEEYEFHSIEELFDSISTDENSVKLPPCHRCTSHTLNLVCTCKTVRERKNRLHRSSFAKCRALWNSIGRSVKKNEAVVNVGGQAVITPGATRWNSLYDSISFLLLVEDKLESMFCAAGVSPLNASEIQFLKEYKECTKPIAQALDRLQGEKGDPNKGCGSYYGVLVPSLLTVHESLEHLNKTSPNMCEKLPSVLLDQFTRRFEKFLNFSPEHNDAIIAAVSHPYFKLRWVPESKKIEFQDLFKNAVLEMADADAVSTSAQTPASSAPLTSENDDDFFKFKSFDATNVSSKENQIEQECRRFLSSAETSLTMLNQFPFVKATFIKYNTPLPSSGPVERIFNFGQMILDPKRQRLTDRNFERSLLLKVNSDIMSS